MSLLDRCRPITILWESQRHKWRIYHELFHFLHRKSLIGRHLVLWDWNFVTEYEGHVFRVATYLAHYWTITWLSSRRQTVISTVLDSDCLPTALLSTAGCKSRDTNKAFLLDFKWSRDIDPALWFAPGLHLNTHCLWIARPRYHWVQFVLFQPSTFLTTYYSRISDRFLNCVTIRVKLSGIWIAI